MPESTTTNVGPTAPTPRTGGPAPVIGLTGAIGGGKSVAAGLLAARGAAVIDADAVGHEALRRPEIVRRVAERFGPETLTAEGRVDRQALGLLVFSDPAALRDLEAIVHPTMVAEFQRRIAEARRRGEAPLIVLDAAVLLEAGWDRLCDATVFVDAPRDVRLDRVRRARGWTEEGLAVREAAQWPLDRKKARALRVLLNDGDVPSLEAEIDRLWPGLTTAAPDSEPTAEPRP